MAWTNENPNEETIKCVVVGDNNVGKTRLICSRAYKRTEQNFSFKKYGGSHVPTVWAIDQYRNNKHVLDNARIEIDDVMVSLRLWDTFGDHHKNRKFAYGRADVAVVCFSVCDRKSMFNIKKFWLKELREHCKKIPVFIVACKTDLRFIDLAELNQHRSRWIKEIKRDDVIFPEESRSFAKELDCYYYESSVLMGYGINDVFDNAIRAALMYRRGLYFWKSTLKRVRRPLMQEPLIPTKPQEPLLLPIASRPYKDFSSLFHDELCSDAQLVSHNKVFHVHKIILASLSDVFLKMFSSSCHDGSSVATSCHNYIGNKVFVMSVNELNKLTEVDSELLSVDKVPNLIGISDVKEVISDGQCTDYMDSRNSINLPSSILPEVLDKVLELCYKGRIYLHDRETSFNQLFERELLEALNFFQISVVGSEIVNNMVELHDVDLVATERTNRIRTMFLCKEILADVIFEVDDGMVPAHKALLIAGCDVMGAMFSGKFSESYTNIVPLPGTLASSLRTVLEYIYTGSSTFSEKGTDFVDLIELTNRLCLTEFMKQIEHHIIMELRTSLSASADSLSASVCSDFIDFLEVGQLHNAQVLVSWCMHLLCVHYNDVCRKCPKKMKLMSSGNLSYLSEQRWPPVWYIKDRDNYEKAFRKRVEQNDEYSCKSRLKSKSRTGNQ